MEVAVVRSVNEIVISTVSSFASTRFTKPIVKQLGGGPTDSGFATQNGDDATIYTNDALKVF